MKKSWIVVVVICFSLSIAACGKEEPKAVKGEKPKITTTDTLAAKYPQELSATVVNTAGGRTMTSKLYMKAGKVRFESEMAGGSYQIIRRDLKKIWMVMTQTKSYMELGEGKEPNAPMPEEKMKGEVSRKLIGNETIDGHPTTKYEVTAKVGEQVMTSYQWIATDINFPVKMAAVDGSWSVEYRDIKIGGQADSLFELPEGYKKMSMPTAPGKISGMMPSKAQ